MLYRRGSLTLLITWLAFPLVLADKLCGKRWDWIEALSKRGPE